MGGDEVTRRAVVTAGLHRPRYDTNIRSHERLQGLIILAVQERKPHIGPLSDSVTLLHLFMRNAPEQKGEGPSEM